jgi:hypothetical protein
MLIVNNMLARMTRLTGKIRSNLIDLPCSNKLTQIYYFVNDVDVVWLESLSEDCLYVSDLREVTYFFAEDLMYQLGV